MADILTRFPKFSPRNDFDILALGDGRYRGPEKGLHAWLDEELASQVAMSGDPRLPLEAARDMLNSPAVVTGVSPELLHSQRAL